MPDGGLNRQPAQQTPTRLGSTHSDAFGRAREFSVGESLQLTRSMRSALSAAVHALLNDPRLVGALDAVRLASVVLLAKAPATSSRVRITYQDLAGWLGYSVSHVGHTVIPALKKAGAVTSKKVRDLVTRHTKAIELDLLPLREARAAGTPHPMALLTQRDLATLLRMCEAVTCPGWEPVDKPATPAGFMAVRRGSDAATDRLAMVLLVLNARPDGRVRMAPGRVAEGFDRADATVARLLDCPMSAAVAVVDRLAALGVVEFGSVGRDRLRIPAVAASYARTRTMSPEKHDDAPPVEPPVEQQGGCPRCAQDGGADNDVELVLAGEGWAQESFDEVLASEPESAFRDQEPVEPSSPQGRAGFEGAGTGSRPAELHAHHAPVANLCGSGAGGHDGFSGSAVLGCDDQRGRAGAGEVQLQDSASGEGACEAGGRPLRGEQPNSDPYGGRQPASREVLASWLHASGGPPKVWATVPRELEQVLRPAEAVWGRLDRRGARRRVLRAIRVELARLSGTFGPEPAAQLLAERLRRRLREQSTTPITDPVGWFVGRGLPRRSECCDQRCDDGRRMDTRAHCDACRLLHADRVALRHTVAAELASEPHLPPLRWQRKELFDDRLRQAHTAHVERRMAELAHQAAQRAAREARAAEEWARTEAAVAERRARPCAVCGRTASDGLCQPCANLQAADRAVATAVDVVTAWTAPDDPSEWPEIATWVESDIRAEVDQAAAVQQQAHGATDETVTLAQKLTAEVAAVEYRSSAISGLSRSAEAEAEAKSAFAAQMRRRHLCASDEDARANAHAAARAARRRTAEHMLATRLAAVRDQRRVPSSPEESDPYVLATARLRSLIQPTCTLATSGR
ncbi:hypothetical protein [Streptomyces sp. WZ-12]|uniref:hypothetical protein n=1 Tax=Streptomyces sp. WZ-12 TaxID=3030210 RepID=UPI00238172BA|nr:hypothetical protein [Streptomyces sp. WZ-12]